MTAGWHRDRSWPTLSAGIRPSALLRVSQEVHAGTDSGVTCATSAHALVDAVCMFEPLGGFDPFGVAQQGPGRGGLAKVAPRHIGAAQVGAGELRAKEVRPAQVAVAQVG